MLYHKAISAEPVRYTAATLEIMRLDGLSHLRCAVNYANDHSAGHLSNTTKAANGYWASKELALREEKREKFKNRELPSEVRAKLERKEARRVRRALRAPYAVGEDGDNAFYSHKETSNFAFVNPKGKRRVELTGVHVDGSFPVVHKSTVVRNAINSAHLAQRKKLGFCSSYSPRHLMEKDAEKIYGLEIKRVPATSSSTRPKSAGASGRVREEIQVTNHRKTMTRPKSAHSFISADAISQCADRVAEQIRALSSASSLSSSRGLSSSSSSSRGQGVGGSKISRNDGSNIEVTDRGRSAKGMEAMVNEAVIKSQARRDEQAVMLQKREAAQMIDGALFVQGVGHGGNRKQGKQGK